jgi:hypothetical protein
MGIKHVHPIWIGPQAASREIETTPREFSVHSITFCHQSSRIVFREVWPQVSGSTYDEGPY